MVHCCKEPQALHIAGACVLAEFLALTGEISVVQTGGRCSGPQPDVLGAAGVKQQPQHGLLVMLCGTNANYPPMSFFQLLKD